MSFCGPIQLYASLPPYTSRVGSTHLGPHPGSLSATMWETLRVAPRDPMTPENLSLKEVWLGMRHLLCLEHHSFTESLMSPSAILAEIEFTAPKNTTLKLLNWCVF